MRGPGRWPRAEHEGLLPNTGSKNQTAASLKIDLHYAKLEIFTRWNYERFLRLAAFLQLTPYELGSLACITHRQVDSFRTTNILSDGFRKAKNYSAALVLTVLEAHACQAFTDDVVKNPFPNLNEVPSA